jgi:3-methyladenine DNA glycosylase AlkD
MDSIIAKIRQNLQRLSDSQTREMSQNFFKEKIKFYGVKTALVTKISKEHYKNIKNKTKAEIFDLCEKFWESGYMEESFIACHWSYFLRKKYELSDFMIFEKWVDNYVSNWASCDGFCNHTMGAFIEMYPEYFPKLKKWAKSKNRWMRRACAVTLIIPAKHGKFLNDIFEIADLLLLDKDDLVQKGYGWMLKAASQAHQKEIFDYVMKNKSVMPRTALRYAIEKMPIELKDKAMEKQSSKSRNRL